LFNREKHEINKINKKMHTDLFKVRPTIRVAGTSRLKAEVIQRRHNQQPDDFVGILFTNILLSSQGHKHNIECRYMSMPRVDFEPMIPGFR
jgi:hypothetical protein